MYEEASAPIVWRSGAGLRQTETGVLSGTIYLLKDIVEILLGFFGLGYANSYVPFMLFLAMERKWIDGGPKMTQAYNHGVKEFMDFAVAHNNGAEDILCPCMDCDNGFRYPID